MLNDIIYDDLTLSYGISHSVFMVRHIDTCNLKFSLNETARNRKRLGGSLIKDRNCLLFANTQVQLRILVWSELPRYLVFCIVFSSSSRVLCSQCSQFLCIVQSLFSVTFINRLWLYTNITRHLLLIKQNN